MGFMTAFATGFANNQNQQIKDQQTEQDQVTKLSLANILQNVNTYNSAKSAYAAKVQKATAISSQFGGQPGDIMNMMNAGMDEGQILLQASKISKLPNNTTTPASNQTAAALSGGSTNGTGLPAPSINQEQANTLNSANSTIPNAPQTSPGAQPSAPAPVQQANTQGGGSPASGPPAAAAAPATTSDTDNSVAASGGIRPTIWNHLFGTDPNANIGANAQGMASQVTGLSKDELNDARTGAYTPDTTLPTTPGYKINPQSLVDWAGFNPANYSSDNVAQAHALWAAGDKGGALALEQNATDKQNATIALEQAKTLSAIQAAAGTESAKEQQDLIRIAALPDPANPGKPLGIQAATSLMMQKKYNYGAGLGADVNPQGLSPEDYYKSLSTADKTLADSYISGRTQWVPGSGKSGIDAQQAILRKVQAVDPTFSPAISKARYNMFQDFNSNKGNTFGGNLASMNATINHTFDFLDAVNKLGNGSSTLVNDVKNFGRSQVSDPTLKNAKQAQFAATQELAKILHGPGTTPEQDTANARDMLPLNTGGVGPDGIPNNQKIVGGLVKVMMDRIQPWVDNYNRVMGADPTNEISPWSVFPKSAVDKLKAMGYPVPENEIAAPPFSTPFNSAPGISNAPNTPTTWTPPATDLKVK